MDDHWRHIARGAEAAGELTATKEILAVEEWAQGTAMCQGLENGSLTLEGAYQLCCRVWAIRSTRVRLEQAVTRGRSSTVLVGESAVSR